MTTIPFVTSDWRRDTGQEPAIKLQNRFFEVNPSNPTEGSSLLYRPGFKYIGTTGAVPPEDLICSMYTQENAFSNDFFVMSPTRVVRRGAVFGASGNTIIGASNDYSLDSLASNKATFTSGLGEIPPYVYFTDETHLWVYGQSNFATTVLSKSAAVSDGDKVQLGNMYYQFTSGSVDAGTPDGSSGNPWLVRNNGNFVLQELALAVDAVGLPGTNYSSLLTKNTLVNFDVGTTPFPTTATATFYAAQGGVLGNTVQANVIVGANLSFTNTPTMAGGNVGNSVARRVYMPRGSGPRALATISGYVLIVDTNQTDENSGRFYWIEPGDTFVNTSSFATAEMLPDQLLSIRVIGDQIYMIGRETTEVWYVTGDADAPFRRAIGRSYNIGAVEATDIVVDDTLFVVSSNYITYQFSGGNPSRVSDNSVEELVRKYVKNQTLNTFDTMYTSTFTVDGHIYFVLGLGKTGTRVYDSITQKWLDWHNSDNVGYLNQHAFIPSNSNLDYPYICAAINGNGLWFVDPEYLLDDINETQSTYIKSIVTAGVPMRMRETVKCNEVYLTGSVGQSIFELYFLLDGDGTQLIDPDGAFLFEFDLDGVINLTIGAGFVTMEYSDDNGRTWVKADADIPIMSGDYNQEVVWRSIGLIQAPGRLFRITDRGSMVRLDGLDIR